MTTENRELFELCKQVYEATGWTGTNQVIGIYYQISEADVKYGIFDRSEKRKEPVDTPLYTSDYLLEKLPSPLIFHNNDCAIEVRRTKKDKYMWSANIRHSYGQFFKQLSDTPLKALLKLTLKLHEEKIL